MEPHDSYTSPAGERATRSSQSESLGPTTPMELSCPLIERHSFQVSGSNTNLTIKGTIIFALKRRITASLLLQHLPENVRDTIEESRKQRKSLLEQLRYDGTKKIQHHHIDDRNDKLSNINKLNNKDKQNNNDWQNNND